MSKHKDRGYGEHALRSRIDYEERKAIEAAKALVRLDPSRNWFSRYVRLERAIKNLLATEKGEERND